MPTTEELTRAGWIQMPDGSFSKAKNATDLLPQGQAPVRRLNSRSAPVLERNPGDGTLGAVQIQGPVAGRFLVRVISVRKRLLDDDNLCEKYHVDCCRYAGLIPGDSPATTKIEVCQEKAEPGQAEQVRIEIYQLEYANKLKSNNQCKTLAPEK